VNLLVRENTISFPLTFLNVSGDLLGRIRIIGSRVRSWGKGIYTVLQRNLAYDIRKPIRSFFLSLSAGIILELKYRSA
jgi:hypothetical protein